MNINKRLTTCTKIIFILNTHVIKHRLKNQSPSFLLRCLLLKAISW